MISHETLRKVQLKELEILLEIKRICEKNNINYFLCFGTLLGAIRHKGFIPWDDDVDIYMKREDYNRFLKIASTQISDKYFIESHCFNSKFPRTFTKIKANETVFLEKYFQHANLHPGIWVDIFPLDSLNKLEPRALKRKINKMHILQSIADYSVNILHPRKIHSKIFLKFFSSLYGKSAISKKEKLMLSNDSNQINYLIDFNNTQANYPIFKKHLFENSIFLEFEGHLFSAPANYDEILTQIYGDYMKFPPKSEQICKHEIIEVVI